MSMEVDFRPATPDLGSSQQEKRKKKDKDHKSSSKKRKYQEDTPATTALDVPPPLKKKRKDENLQRSKSPLSPSSSQLLNAEASVSEQPSSTPSKKKKKHKRIEELGHHDAGENSVNSLQQFNTDSVNEAPQSINSSPSRKTHKGKKRRRSKSPSRPPRSSQLQDDALSIEPQSARASPSRKYRRTEPHQPTSSLRFGSSQPTTDALQTASPSPESSPFHLCTASFFLPLPPISISETHALPALLSEHISPLLLTYHAPFRGIILSFSHPTLSSTRPTTASPQPPNEATFSFLSSSDPDQDEQHTVLAHCPDEYGVSYLWLTATFLVFRPSGAGASGASMGGHDGSRDGSRVRDSNQNPLRGTINISSSGFLGCVVYNLFSAGIERRRLPKTWKWVPPGRDHPHSTTKNKTKKVKLKSQEDEEDDGDDGDIAMQTAAADEDEEADPHPTTATNQPDHHDENSRGKYAGGGYFTTEDGTRVKGVISFRVKDVEVVPGPDRERGFLSIEGTMLEVDEEEELVEEERARDERRRRKGGRKSGSGEGGGSSDDVVMAGAVG